MQIIETTSLGPVPKDATGDWITRPIEAIMARYGVTLEYGIPIDGLSYALLAEVEYPYGEIEPLLVDIQSILEGCFQQGFSSGIVLATLGENSYRGLDIIEVWVTDAKGLE